MAGHRKLAAILVADIVGYSRLTALDEDRTIARVRTVQGDASARPPGALSLPGRYRDQR